MVEPDSLDPFPPDSGCLATNAPEFSVTHEAEIQEVAIFRKCSYYLPPPCSHTAICHEQAIHEVEMDLDTAGLL